MNFKLNEGLVRLGNGVTSVYKRVSKASDEEKNQAGFEANEEVIASVGIASINEYITMFVRDLGRHERAVFDLTQFDQPMRLDSLYIDDPNLDAVRAELFLPDGTQLLRQNFSRNRTPVDFPTAPLPNNVVIKVTALTPVNYVQIVLTPVVILANIEGKKETITNDSRTITSSSR